jgi:DNA invertase Pin-like site-specific DNA recombinase
VSGTTLSAIDVARQNVQSQQLRAVAYLRVSTEEQKKGYGIDYTGKRVVRHLAKKGWRLVDTFADEGFNGSLEWHERPELKRLMESVRMMPRPFDVVCVYEERAIGRTGRAFWPWVWELEDLGVFTAIVRGDYDNTTDEGRSRMRKAQDRAEDERILIRDRTQGGIQEAAEQRADEAGYVGGQPPYGWRIKNQGRKGEAVYALDDGEQGEWHTLDAARRLVVENRGDIEKAAALLNARGALTRNGRMWTRENLQARLMSDAVLNAQVTFRDTRAAQNRVKRDADGSPLYGETTVIRIPAAFTAREIAELKAAVTLRRFGPKGGDRTYPLSQRIVSVCGAPYTGCAPGARARRYRCSGKRPKYAGAPVCSCHQIDAAELEGYVWGKLVKLLKDPDELSQRAGQWVGLHESARVDFAQRLASLDREIAQKDRAIGAVMAAAALDGDSPEEAIRIATKALKEQRAELAQQRAEVVAWQAESTAAQDRARELQRLADLAAKRLARVTLEDQAEIVGMMNVRITLLDPVPDAAQSCPVTNWFRDTGRAVPVLTDDGWAVVEPLIRARHRPDRRLPQRVILDALLHKARHEASWPSLSGFANPEGLRAAWGRWSASGVWADVVDALGSEDATVPPSRLPRMTLKLEVFPGLILNSTREDSITCDPRATSDQVPLRVEILLTP